MAKRHIGELSMEIGGSSASGARRRRRSSASLWRCGRSRRMSATTVLRRLTGRGGDHARRSTRGGARAHHRLGAARPEAAGAGCSAGNRAASCKGELRGERKVSVPVGHGEGHRKRFSTGSSRPHAGLSVYARRHATASHTRRRVPEGLGWISEPATRSAWGAHGGSTPSQALASDCARARTSLWLAGRRRSPEGPGASMTVVMYLSDHWQIRYWGIHPSFGFV